MNPSERTKGKTMGLFFKGVLCCILGCAAPLAHTPLDPSRVIEFKISKSGLTRISIDNDSIEDVYAYPAEPELVTHHKSGHVFITPDDLEIPVYLTVITRRGAAQDLRLIPAPKRAEPILLRFEEAPLPQIPLSSLSPQDVSAHLLAQFIKGKVPNGFTLTAANGTCAFDTRAHDKGVCDTSVSDRSVCELNRGEGPVEATLDKVYQNGQFRVLVFAIKNESPERHTLDNKVFWGKGDLASAFDRPTLGSQETARLFVVQQR